MVELERGDVLVFYTDGVTEVRRQRREVFGTEQLIELLQQCGGLSPAEVAERVEKAVMHASMGRLRDDMAVLALGPADAEARRLTCCRPPTADPTPKESDG